MFRAVLPPLVIVTTVVTALGLFLTAAAIDAPIITGVVPASSVTTDEDVSSTRPGSVGGGQTSGPISTSLVRTPPLALPSSSMMVGLSRLIYPPGTGASRSGLPGPMIIATQSGTLTVDLDGSAQFLRGDREAVEVTGEHSLASADGLVLLSGTGFAAANQELPPAVVLAAVVFPTSAVKPTGSERSEGVRWPDNVTPGAMIQPLAGGWVVDMGSGSASLELSRILVQSGESLQLNEYGVSLLSVEAGVLTVVAEHGLAWSQPADGPDGWIDAKSATTLLPDDGAMFQSGAHVTLRNDGSGPALVIVLTVIPVDGASGPPDAD